MPLPSAIKLFIDPKMGMAFSNFAGSSQINNPTFTLGDTAGVEIYLVENTQVASYPRQEINFPATPGIKVAIGPIDQSPTSGTFSMSYGGNTTSDLPYNATPAQVQTALNALAIITAAGGVTVSKVGDNYNILFNQDGARTELTTDSTSLIPLSTVNVATLQTGTINKPHIFLVHLQVTVAGLATTFTQTVESEITITSLGAWDGNKATYRLSIAPDPKGGSFTLGFDASSGDDVSTASINVGASSQDLQNALNTKSLADKVSVTQVGAYAYDITVSTQPGTNGLTANDAGILSFNGYVGDLSLNTAEAISLLDGAESVETMLEVEITSDSKTLTMLQIQCTLKNAVIDAGAVEPLVLDTYLSQTTADGRYLRQSNNLSDLGNVTTSRTNLGVYSTSHVDTSLALKANLIEPVFSGKIQTPTIKNILNDDLVIDSYNDTGAGTHYLHKFTPFDGKLVLATNGGGLTFPDGTTQATAFTGSAATAWGTVTGTLANQTDLAQALSAKANLTGATFSGQLNVGSMDTNAPRTEIQTSTIGATVSLTKGASQQAVISIGEALDNKPFVFLSGASGTASIHSGKFFSGGLFDGVEPYARKDGATFTGKINLPDLGTNTPSFNIGGTALSTTATSAVSGDVWISGTSPKITYKVGTSNFYCATSNLTNTFSSAQIIDTTTTTPALRITQKGAGSALVVEDSTTPDSDALIVDANGNLGIGVSNNPGSIWTGTGYKMEVNGDAKVTGTLRVNYQIDVGTVNDASMIVQSSINFPNYGGTLAGFTTQTNGVHTSGNMSFHDYPMEIVIKLNSNLYAIPCRQIV